MAQVVQHAPLDQPLTEPSSRGRPWDQFSTGGLVTRIWAQFFRWAQAILNMAPQVNGSVDLATQAASIAATAIPATFPTLPNEPLLPGVYRVSYYTRISQAASTSSELTISIRWVDGGVTITQAGTLLNGNTTSTYQQATFLIRVDAESSVSYLTTYVSVGGTPMQYRLHVRLEAVPEAA